MAAAASSRVAIARRTSARVQAGNHGTPTYPPPGAGSKLGQNPPRPAGIPLSHVRKTITFDPTWHPGPKGFYQSIPLLTQRNAVHKLLLSAIARIGFSPAGRARVPAAMRSKGGNPFEAFVK